jgi:membrane protease YdiL (CAAX protease family)
MTARPVAAADRGSGRLIAWTSVVAVFSLLAYAGRYAGGEEPKDPLYHWSSVANGLIQYAIFLGITLAIVVGAPKRSMLALRRPTSWLKAAGIAFGVVVLILVLSGIASLFFSPGKEQGLVPSGWDPHRASPFFANFVIVGLVAPVVEELFFRGLGFTLLARYGQWAAVLLVGAAFGLAHGLVEAFPLLFAFGAGLAYLRARVRSVYPGMIVHAGYNCLVLLAAVRFFNT